VGAGIIATWQPHAATVEDVIAEMQLNWQIILNKRAVMVLPRGIDKASGLRAACQDLDLALSDVVGVGDAENDLHLLEVCGCGVAVANAVAELKAKAAWVTASERGQGVQELIQRWLTV
jgi:hydroxymethylpyrimidine pyrophosphatase-like HAD family hydrolase